MNSEVLGADQTYTKAKNNTDPRCSSRSKACSERNRRDLHGMEALIDRFMSDDEASGDTESSLTPASQPETDLYEGLPAERKDRAKDYIRALNAIEVETETATRIQSTLDADNQTYLDMIQELEFIDEAKATILDYAQTRYNKTVEKATQRLNERIRSTETEIEAEKRRLEALSLECAKRIVAAEAHISEYVLDAESAREKKRALEQEGGFQLGLDVGAVEERRKRRRL